MALEKAQSFHLLARIAFVLMILACITPMLIRSHLPSGGPSITVVLPQGTQRTITLSNMMALHPITQEGSYQNQYGNWRDQGTYTGVLLTELFADQDYVSIEIVARDGYRMMIDRARVEDEAHPMVLAFRMNGEDVPDWEDGFRIVVLPADGGTSNVDYGVESAGSYWVRQVHQIILHP